MLSKKWVIVSVAAVVLSGTSIMAFAKANPIKVMLNGTEFVTEIAPQKMNDQIMLSVQDLAHIFGKRVSFDNKQNAVHVNNKSQMLVAETEDHTVQITGDQGEMGIVEHLELKTPEFSRAIPGINVDNPTYAPVIISADVDGDGQKEWIIILTTGYGTGVYESKVFVVNAITGKEIPVEDAKTLFLKQFNGQFSEKGASLNISDKDFVIPPTKIQTDASNRFTHPSVGSIIQYDVEGDLLKATTAVQLSPTEFVGDVTIEYSFKNGVLQGNTVDFTLYPEYKS
ncbi:stalk domain-containing protein [Paenibacillus pini]|uniref:Copper amine oxidase-like N-terminal domain-containing protein n=1 Tax=Paenibacillus pini JCM 16418 TaxID=1236976 RepID=W7YDF2_9BACL|nr:stalk domain-containing protein [Paenibacillus pini]GAF08955.1 hypothetical protein JCM16418_3066 [Paenibacillus pini JCM 16418]